jgi:hypothetical protein
LSELPELRGALGAGAGADGAGGGELRGDVTTGGADGWLRSGAGVTAGGL